MTTDQNRQDPREAAAGEDGEPDVPGDAAESPANEAGQAAMADAPAQTEQAPRKTFLEFLRSITLLRRKRNEARQQHNAMPQHFAQLDSVVETRREHKPDDDEPIRSAN